MSHSCPLLPRARARVGGLSFALCLVFSVTPLCLFAADSEVTNVKFSSTCSDGVGKELSYLVREEIRKSAGYRLVDSQEGLVYELSLTCLANDDDANAIARFASLTTMYARDWPFPYAIAHGIQNCGRNRVEECARSIVAGMDSTITQTRIGLRNWMAKQKQAE